MNRYLVPESLFTAAGEMEAARRRLKDHAVMREHDMTVTLPARALADFDLYARAVAAHIIALTEQK